MGKQVLAYHQCVEGVIELILEPQELFGLAVVMDQLAEASPMCYQGDPLRNLSQRSRKDASDTHLSIRTEYLTQHSPQPGI